MFRSILLLSGVAATLVVVTGIGCNQSNSAINSALLAKHQARLVMTEEPDGVQTVLDVREALLGESIGTHEHADHEHADHEHADHDEHNHADHDDHAEHNHEEDHAHEHEEIVEIEPTEPIDVQMVGTIGGLTNPWEETQPNYPFTKNQASFFLADPSAIAELDASGHNHAPGEECTFCAAHAAEGSALLAMVRFLDENGKVLAIGVPRMFDVKERDTVVIQGSARIVAGGMLVVDATGIYVRR